MERKQARTVVPILFAFMAGTAVLALWAAGQSIEPQPGLRVTGFVTLHERRPQDYLIIGLHLWRPGIGPVNNAKVVVNGVLAPHCSPGDYSGGANVADVSPGLALNLTIFIDGREVVKGQATLPAKARFIRPKTDELIDRRLARLVPVEWAFTSGSWVVYVRVRKLPEKTDVYMHEGIHGNRWDVPISGFPPASEADILVHTYFGEMSLTGSLTADSKVKFGYSNAQYVRTIN